MEGLNTHLLCVCSHYFVNGGWFEEDDHILSRVDSIRQIPTTIVQGRYDMITPTKTAWELHKVGRNARITIWGFQIRHFQCGIP